MESNKTTRREFCVHAVSFVTVGALLESCGGSPTSASSVPTLSTISGSIGVGNTIQVTIDPTASPLSAVGSAALLNTSSGNLLVARTGQDTFNAMTAICTHEGCTVDRYQSSTFTCPCHGSQYSTSGAVVKGPATTSLKRFNTSFSGNVLTVSLT